MSGNDDVVIVVRGRADSSATRVFDRVGDSAQDMERDVRRATERAGQDLDSVGDHAQGAEDGLGGVGDSAEEAGGGMGKFAMVGTAALAAVAAGAELAKKAFDFLKESIKIADERAGVIGKAGARAGLDPKQMAELGKKAGEVYADNFGESFEEAANYARDTARFITSVTDPEFKHISELVGNLSTEMEEDSSQVARAIATMLRTGMAKNAAEAADILQAGINKGADAAEDLLDTFSEYSTQFRKLGMDGKEAMGLLSQGLKAGARDADTVADALKEFSIRARDGSTTSAAGFKAIGLDAQKMTKIFAAGGKGAEEGLNLVLAKLRAMKDPVAQEAAAVALFGTKAEDLGAALYALDPSTAVAALGEVGGAADDAAKKMGDTPLAMLKSYQRQWENLQASIGQKMVPVIKEIQKYIEILAEKIRPYIDEILPDLKRYWEENHDSIMKFVDFMNEAVIPVFGATLIFAIKAAIGVGLLFIKWMAEVGETWQRIKDVTKGVMDAFISALGTILDAATEAFGWMPLLGPKLKEAQRQFHEFADSANDSLESIHDRDVIVSARVVTANFISHRASGGYASGLTEVNERGSEYVDFGAIPRRVFNAGESRAMASGGGGGQAYIAEVRGGSGISAADAFMVRWINEKIRKGDINLARG